MFCVKIMYELTQALNDELDFAAARNFHLLVQNEKKNWRLCWDAVTCTLEQKLQNTAGAQRERNEGYR